MDESGDKVTYVTKADWIPSFWNYLVGLDRDDLIAELIQNDLDQNATRTLIEFKNDQLVCEGNGKPVDAEGWQRLSVIQGAGDSVPAKHGKIGVKNHGLKTAFTLGDEIKLMSDGKAVVQTLYAKGRNSSPYPGASEKPANNSQAPDTGCRVVIQYRTKSIRPTQGEAIELSGPTEDDIDLLFQNACAIIPEQFAGIVSPGIVTQYLIVLKHWRLGEARFHFKCTRSRRVERRMETFRRRCEVAGTVSQLPREIQEQAVRRYYPLKGRLKKRIADFYVSGKRYFAEVSWPINEHGKPSLGTGRFRYPIGYPEGSLGALTGHGAYFNVPVVSDSERHAPAPNEKTNIQLREVCDKLLIDALAYVVIPRWGPDGLNPLVPNQKSDNEIETVCPLLAELVRRNKMPVLDWRTVVALLFKGKKQRFNAAIQRIASQRRLKEKRKYAFVIPMGTWTSDSILPALSLLCPRSEKQLHPKINAEIIRLLCDTEMEGFCSVFITYDENDAFSRVISEGNEYFGPIAKPEIEFAAPIIASAYLDLISSALDADKCDDEKEKTLIDSLLMPNSRNQAKPLTSLYSSNLLRFEIPGLRIPPIIHPDLVGHPLLRRRGWRPVKFTMATFFKDDPLEDADEQTRIAFHRWLRRNFHLVSRSYRPKLAELAIWPDNKGRPTRITDLCEPTSVRVQTILSEFIRRPEKQLLRSNLVALGKKGKMSIRTNPTIDEISEWFDARLSQFELGEIPVTTTVKCFRRFENELITLIQDKAILKSLKCIDTTIPGLSQDGSIQARDTLVSSSQIINRLALPKRFLLDCRQGTASLDKLSPALEIPTISMLIDTLAEDSSNFSSLHSRLKILLSSELLEDEELERIANLPIIPLNGQARRPSELAFKGPKGDVWGAWKITLPAKGLSKDEQKRLREVGVTRGVPDMFTSKAFFDWLETLGRAELRQHVPCVFRHILHDQGPIRWASSFTNTPIVPVNSKNGLQLVSLKTIARGSVFLNDAGDIGDEILAKDARVFLAIDSVEDVSKPITEQCRILGVKSLRNALNEPISTSGEGEVTQVSDDMYGKLNLLKQRGFQNNFRKKLNFFGVPGKLIRHDWHDRLNRVQEIKIADKVEATYRFRNKTYRNTTDGEFDPSSGIFWIKRDSNTSVSVLYESIAKTLIFKPTAQPMHYFTLERAVKLEISDPSFGERVPASDATATDPFTDSDYDESSEEDEVVEAGHGHSPYKPDETHNVPNPGQIPTQSASSRHKGRTKNKRQRDNSSDQTPNLEKEQIDDLKSNQYANHCQMCLCEQTPQKLAPRNSYVFDAKVRKRVIDAHHVDHRSAKGARHAGNLILLCKYHHNNYGNRLARDKISQALRSNSNTKAIRFGAKSKIEGKQVEYEISDTGEVVNIFFTNQHADFWLENHSKS